MLVITPPFQVPDEPHHFMRAYQVSEGVLAPTFRDFKGGGEIPQSIARFDLSYKVYRHGKNLESRDQIFKTLQIPLEPGRVQWCEFSNTAAYSPLPYVPQAIAIAIGRPLGMTVLELMYFGRLANLLVWTASGYAALRIAPGFRRPVFLLMLMPMSIYLAASLSADVVGNALVVLFCAMVWRYSAEPDAVGRIKPPEILVLILLACGIGLAKFVYVPVAALVVLIPRRAWGGTQRKRAIIAAVVGLAIMAAVCWSLETPGLDMIANGVSGNFSPRLQLEFLRENPAAWPIIAVRTLREYSRPILISFVGEFGWLDRPVAGIVAFGYYAALLWACLSCTKDLKIRSMVSWITTLCILAAGSAFLIVLTAYLYWNPLAEPEVSGLQGRYFIALAPPLMMLMCAIFQRFSWAKRLVYSDAKMDFASLLIAVTALSYSLCIIYIRFHSAS